MARPDQPTPPGRRQPDEDLLAPAVADEEKFYRQLKWAAIGFGVFATLAAIGGILAVTVFR